jgi:hypothetical protein
MVRWALPAELARSSFKLSPIRRPAGLARTSRRSKRNARPPNPVEVQNQCVVDLPDQVLSWVRSVFAACNARTTEKLSLSPNAPEESLDLTWIEHLSRFSSPVTLGSGWLVKIETHYLGGMRHFRRWEIADIGLLAHLRLGEKGRMSKVALLQSKRLYPDGTPIREETLVDYEIGFARLADPEDRTLSIGFDTEFRFTDESRYGAIRQSSDQVAAIADYEKEVGLKVYYQLYNPWLVPFVQRIPLIGYYAENDGAPDLGVRIVPASLLRTRLGVDSRPSPVLSDLAAIPPLPAYGWRLEDFVCDELLACREGDRFGSIGDAPIQQLFNRRSGAIAAAIAITIEVPNAPAPATSPSA